MNHLHLLVLLDLKQEEDLLPRPPGDVLSSDAQVGRLIFWFYPCEVGDGWFLLSGFLRRFI